MTTEDRSLQDLFASLRSSSSSGPRTQPFSPQQALNASAQNRQGLENTSFSLHGNSGNQLQGTQNVPLPAQPPSHSSTPSQAANPERTASLLNLLKFSNQTSPGHQSQAQVRTHSTDPDALQAGRQFSQQVPSPATQNVHGRGVSASDLVASFMGKPQPPPARTSESPAPVVEPTPVSSANPQDYLLQLLNRSQSSPAARPQQPTAQHNSSIGRSGGPTFAQEAHKPEEPSNNEPNLEKTEHSDPTIPPPSVRSESKEPATLEPIKVPVTEPKFSQPSQPIFTYVNPFDQLAASSPRNRSGVDTPPKEASQPSRLNSVTASAPNKSKPQSPGPRQQGIQDDLTTSGTEVLRSVDSPDSFRLEDGRSKVEALIGIGAPTTDTETVTQALSNVGERVSQQVDNALAQTAIDELKQISNEAHDLEEKVDNELYKFTAEVQEELEPFGDKDVLEVAVDNEAAEAVGAAETALNEAADGHGSADDEKSSGNIDEDYSVPVYNFPMKPFASIELIQQETPQIQFRENVITDIARLKKEFDQIDRTLATASSDYIIYAMPKPGGIRVIRQEDGADRQIFKETKDHVFNVAVSPAPRGKNEYDLQSCIATAVSGTVYWTALYYSGDNIDADDIEQHCLVFPPVSAHEEHTSGGQLKTRAKKSNRHPELFAIGRGKSIQVIFPLHAMGSTYVGPQRVVDTESYFRDRSLKINTGKAGKDFTFSEDDTVIATLDKAGRLRFWDVRELVDDSNNKSPDIAPVEIRTSLATFPTSMPNEKSWPTSVLFVDKLRAYAKGVAQRYIIVGLKQNHILQLWDLGIGKVIQEVHFPHAKESDAICSLCYHPGSGIIVVGHPTRNSVYFIHLSAPKYNLPGMTQARYMTKLVDKDPSLPKPEATAIMSGMREISFASKGQLRSIDLLPMSNDSSVQKDEPGLFELYVMHSKGVTYLNINKSDLGWSDDNKVVDARDAEASGLIKIKELVQPPPTTVSESSSVNGDIAPRQALSSASKDLGKKIADATSLRPGESSNIGVEPIESGISKAPQNGIADKSEKRKKKKSIAASVLEEGAIPPAAPMAPPSYVTTTIRSPAPPSVAPSIGRESVKSSKRRNSPAHAITEGESITMGISSDFLDKELKKIEDAVSSKFTESLGKELDTLYTRFTDDKRVLQAQSGAQQEAVLRLVSTQLGDNTEKSLKKIVQNSIKEEVVPAINTITANTIQKELPQFISSNLLKSLPGTVKQALTETVHTTIQKPDVLRTLSNEVTSKVSANVDKQFSSLFESIVVPAFKDLTLSAASKLAIETEQRISQQLDRVNVQHREDTAKIDQLTNVVRSLSETIQSMAAAQSEFQKEILKLQQQQSRSLEVESSPAYADTIISKPTPEPEITAEMRELETIRALMGEGKFEEGTITWLQSSDQGGIFDNLFVNANPEYLQHCSPLVTLSVSAAVTATLESHVEERLHWLDIVLSTINARDPEVQEVAPKIMDVLCQRLESRYMEMSEFDNTNPVLRKFPALKRKAREISNLSRA